MSASERGPDCCCEAMEVMLGRSEQNNRRRLYIYWWESNLPKYLMSCGLNRASTYNRLDTHFVLVAYDSTNSAEIKWARTQ